MTPGWLCIVGQVGRGLIVLIALGSRLALTPAAEFMAGADVSSLTALEARGAVYRDAGQPRDALEMFADHGVNWYRLRLFVNPNGQDVVVNDLAYTLALAQRVKSVGGKLLLDFHYSDAWADPGRQTRPAAWSGLGFAQLEQRVHDYTRDVLQAFAAEEVWPEMVQIGNEISNGLLWSDGYPWSGGSHDAGFDRLATLLKAGIAGARAGSPVESQPLIMLHHHEGANWATASYYFHKLAARNVDFDVIGYSYYPKFHYDPASGAGSIADLAANLYNTATTFGKPVAVVETGFASRGAQYEPEYEFPVSVAGQQQFFAAVIDAVEAVPDDLGRGVFWWYPEARPVNGLSVWEGGRYGWFDANGNLLPTISALGSLDPPSRPGDFNRDGNVDALDLAAWQIQFGQAPAGLAADADRDGDVDAADFLSWQRHLDAPPAPPLAVPEPEVGSGAILAMASMLVLASSRAALASARVS